MTLSGHSLERNPASQQADEVHRISVFQAFDVFDAMRAHALIWIKFAPESWCSEIDEDRILRAYATTQCRGRRFRDRLTGALFTGEQLVLDGLLDQLQPGVSVASWTVCVFWRSLASASAQLVEVTSHDLAAQ